MGSLTETVRRVMLGYAGEALNGYSYLTSSADEDVFTVVSVGKVHEERIVNTGLLFGSCMTKSLLKETSTANHLLMRLSRRESHGNTLSLLTQVKPFPN
jgi:hypothetical protein